MTAHAYAAAGVDIEAGDDFSAFCGRLFRSTWAHSPFVEVHDYSSGHFRGPRAFRYRNLPADALFDAAPDGIGTKSIVIDAAGSYTGAAANLVAMTAGDVTRWGGKPCIFINNFDVSSLGRWSTASHQAARRLMEGLALVAGKQRFVCFKGETAELGPCVGSENHEATLTFNWCGVMLGVYLPDRMITGSALEPGQAVVALWERGLRSNGISAARRALRNRFGEEWWRSENAGTMVGEIAYPATLYDIFLADMNGWMNRILSPSFKFHLISHITGGGIVSKFAEDMLFPRGLSAELDGLFPPSETMKQVVEWSETPEEERYQTFCCNNGVLVVLDEFEVDAFVKSAKSYDLLARRAGRITKEHTPELRIKSGFSGRSLSYHPKAQSAS